MGKNKDKLKIKKLNVMLDYSKTWSIATFSAFLVASIGILQQKLYSSGWWTLLIIMIGCGLATNHMTSKYELRQKELIKEINHQLREK